MPRIRRDDEKTRETGPQRGVQGEDGAGGYGDPSKCDPQAVLADVQNGVVSVAGAKRDYGIAVDLRRGIAIRRRARG